MSRIRLILSSERQGLEGFLLHPCREEDFTKRATITLLAGDIGATNSRISLYEVSTSTPGQLTLKSHNTYPSQEHASLLEILQHFTRSLGVTPDFGCFGIPGPVKGDTSVTTNLPWQVHGDEIARGIGIRKVWLLNDLEAIAHGLLRLDDRDLVILNPSPLPGEGGNAAVIAPGSGLGEAGIYWDGERYHPFGSEGGHCNFAPADADQIEILQYLLKKYARVSWERLLSGPGLVHIYSFLRDTGREQEPDWLHERLKVAEPAKVITDEAIHGKAEICKRTVQLFLDLLACEAANLALKLMSTGGVYIAGGIVPRLLPLLDRERFQQAFVRQGRLSKVLETVPVRLVMNGDVGIIGAAHYALTSQADHAELPVGLASESFPRKIQNGGIASHS
jgi:glucokinase